MPNIIGCALSGAHPLRSVVTEKRRENHSGGAAQFAGIPDNTGDHYERGSITLDVHPHADGVEITVADTGVGIASDAILIIFDAFRQVDSSTTRHYGGVGLGLYIVRRFLDLLGGSITVESEVGRGSTFRIFLPTA